MDETSGNLLAYRWKGPDGYRVVILNLGPGAAQGRVRLTGDLEASPHYDLVDRLNDQSYVRDRDDLETNDGLYVRLDGYKGHVFAVSPHA